MFKNRQQAGQLLAEKIAQDLQTSDLKKLDENTLVLGIPRGGVVIARQVADILNCSLDVIVVKKLGAPGQSELAIGAMGETSGSIYLDKRLIKELRIGKDYIENIKKLRYEEIREREQLYREGKRALDLKDKIVIIVDDGAATGATVIAAAREVWNNSPRKVVIALPVIAKDTLEKLEKEADEVIYLDAPRFFYAVGQFYEDFPQVSDEEVIEILKQYTSDVSE